MSAPSSPSPASPSQPPSPSAPRPLGALLGAVGALFGGLAVATGAMGAHALKAILNEQQLGWWDKAAHYHLIHALAVLACGLAWRSATAGSRQAKAIAIAGALFLAGIMLFSGSLYALALTNVLTLGAVTPFGGVAFIAGWVALAIGLWPAKSKGLYP